MSGWLFVKAVHLFAGVFWMGAAVLVVFFIVPAVQAAGPPGGAVMRSLTTDRRLPQWINAAAVLTTFSGLLMYWRVSGGLNPQFLEMAPGLGLTVGSLFGVLAFMLGVLVQSPRAKRIGELGARMQAAPDPALAAEMGAQQQKLRRGGVLGVCLLALSLVGMLSIHPM